MVPVALVTDRGEVGEVEKHQNPLRGSLPRDSSSPSFMPKVSQNTALPPGWLYATSCIAYLSIKEYVCDWSNREFPSSPVCLCSTGRQRCVSACMTARPTLFQNIEKCYVSQGHVTTTPPEGQLFLRYNTHFRFTGYVKLLDVKSFF